MPFKTQHAPKAGPRRSRPIHKRSRPVKRKVARGGAKHLKVQQKKQRTKGKLSARQQKALAALKKGTTLMVAPTPVGVDTTSLKALYRMVQANVAYYYPRVNVELVADPTGQPALSPAGFAAFFLWAVITAVRKNGSAVDKVPDPNTLPDFNSDYKIPNSLALFIVAWLRNKGKTFSVYNELPTLVNILTGSISTNIAYNATVYSVNASPYGDLVQPNDPGTASEFMFNNAAASTFTVDQMVAAGDRINNLIATCGGTVPFSKIFWVEEGETKVIPYKSPVLFANPTADGFDCRVKLQEEVAALVIDYSTPNANSDGLVLKPYPMANQDKYVLGAVNLLNHCKGPTSSYFKKEWRFPRDYRKIIDPTRGNHRWHALGRIKTLRVTTTSNVSCWLSVQKNICEQLCAVYSGTTLTALAALEANEMNLVMQTYVFCHLMEWSWMHFTRPLKLQAGQYLNAVLSGCGGDWRSLPVPQNITEIVRNWRPIVVAGQVMIPDVPQVAFSTYANFLTFGTGGTYAGTNTVTFQNTAAPNGYNFAMTGLYSTNIVPSAPFAATAYNIHGITFTNANFGTTGITATLQSPTVPIKFTNLFVADWKQKFVAASNQKMFNMDYPILGDWGMLACVDIYQRTGGLFGAGWQSIRLDYTMAQVPIAADRVAMWKAVQYSRLNVLVGGVTGGTDYTNYKLMIVSGDGGVLANVETFAKDDLGQEYNSLLTGMEANPRFTNLKMKPWIALDNIVARLYDQRGGGSFEEFTTKDAFISLIMGLREQAIHMGCADYSDDNDLFKPNSLSGWMSVLAGVEATYNTGKYIFTDIFKTFGGLFGLKTLTLV